MARDVNKTATLMGLMGQEVRRMTFPFGMAPQEAARFVVLVIWFHHGAKTLTAEM